MKHFTFDEVLQGFSDVQKSRIWIVKDKDCGIYIKPGTSGFWIWRNTTTDMVVGTLEQAHDALPNYPMTLSEQQDLAMGKR